MYPKMFKPTLIEKITLFICARKFIKLEKLYPESIRETEIYLSKCPYCGAYTLDYLHGYYGRMNCSSCRKSFYTELRL